MVPSANLECMWWLKIITGSGIAAMLLSLVYYICVG